MSYGVSKNKAPKDLMLKILSNPPMSEIKSHSKHKHCFVYIPVRKKEDRNLSKSHKKHKGVKYSML